MSKVTFENLMSEVACINHSFGYRGVFDAIVYIDAHRDEYKGTAVYNELQEFMALGAKMFATKEAA